MIMPCQLSAATIIQYIQGNILLELNLIQTTVLPIGRRGISC
jgi:hypothetical protein